VDAELLDRRPVVVALAGPNGAGKSTFFEAFLQPAALRFVNADAITKELSMDAYAAAELAASIREELLARGESFIFETVLSDPVGEKVAFLKKAAEQGYTVIFCFIGLDSAEQSDERVAIRVSQGGHDIPTDKLLARYPRTLANLARAIRSLPLVFIYDNGNLAEPFRLVAEYRNGERRKMREPMPEWLREVTKSE